MERWSNYAEEARLARVKILELIFRAQTSHIGSNYSCVDIFAVLFSKLDFEKDIFLLSKGWAAATLYYFLWRCGRMTQEELDSYCQPDSKFIGLTEPVHPDIKFAGGSMGLSLPAAVGFALAKKLKGEEGRVYVLMSDGEIQIGTTYEAFLIAEHHQLDNLTILVDWNGLQAMGATKDILNIDLFFMRKHVFDGHNYAQMKDHLFSPRGAPHFMVMHTVKGKGVSFMENKNLYHYKAPSEEEYTKALAELHG